MSESANFELEYDLNDVREWNGEGGGAPSIEPGTYDFEITGAKSDVAKSSNKPVVAVEFTVVSEGPAAGEKFTKKYSLSPQAVGRLKNLMVACNARLDKIRGEDLLGRVIRAEVIHRPGETRFDTAGQPLPERMFLDIMNETAIEPVKQAAPAPNANGKAPVRRAVGPAQAR